MGMRDNVPERVQAVAQKIYDAQQELMDISWTEISETSGTEYTDVKSLYIQLGKIAQGLRDITFRPKETEAQVKARELREKAAELLANAEELEEELS